LSAGNATARALDVGLDLILLFVGRNRVVRGEREVKVLAPYFVKRTSRSR
jgi:hypothetical protein